jgi:septal ring factor EnvC (AmiA/AmiB activator)
MAKRTARRGALEPKYFDLYEGVREHLAKTEGPRAQRPDAPQALADAQAALAEKEAELARLSRRFHETDYELICARHDLEAARAAIAVQALQICELIEWKRERRRALEAQRVKEAREGCAPEAAAFSSANAD